MSSKVVTEKDGEQVVDLGVDDDDRHRFVRIGSDGSIDLVEQKRSKFGNDVLESLKSADSTGGTTVSTEAKATRVVEDHEVKEDTVANECCVWGTYGDHKYVRGAIELEDTGVLKVSTGALASVVTAAVGTNPLGYFLAAAAGAAEAIIAHGVQELDGRVFTIAALDRDGPNCDLAAVEIMIGEGAQLNTSPDEFDSIRSETIPAAHIDRHSFS